jgi:hypothetical protein
MLRAGKFVLDSYRKIKKNTPLIRKHLYDTAEKRD